MRDDELKELLKSWQAPEAPPSLERSTWERWRPRRPAALLAWLLTGTVRIPVPVCGLVAAALIMSVGVALRPAPPVVQSHPQLVPVSIGDFRPVQELTMRVVRED